MSFEATFMTGFGVSAVNGYPDTQLVSFAEMQQRCTTIAEALGSVALEHGVEPLPCIAVRSRFCWVWCNYQTEMLDRLLLVCCYPLRCARR
jgi:hypothetical protein